MKVQAAEMVLATQPQPQAYSHLTIQSLNCAQLPPESSGAVFWGNVMHAYYWGQNAKGAKTHSLWIWPRFYLKPQVDRRPATAARGLSDCVYPNANDLNLHSFFAKPQRLLKASAITLGWSSSLSAKVVQNLHRKQSYILWSVTLNLILSSGV